MKYKLGAVNLSSSTDPEKMGNTVKAVILGGASIILLVAGYFGVPFTQGDVMVLATSAGTAVSSLGILYGLIQKVVVYLSKQY